MGAYNLMVGADPELFLKKGRSYACAEGVIPGDKHKPYPVDKGAVQVDGMAVEFNINPAESEEEFSENITSVMLTLDEMVGEHELICKPSVVFNEKVWAEASEESKILGCEPDYNAWTGKVNPKPNANVKFRTAAGHVHIGWTEGEDITDPHHINECEAIVKELDYRLGFPSVLLDEDTRRRTLYGKVGAYRPKSYGVEYRVLSNFWLKDARLQRWVFNVVKETLKDLHEKRKTVFHKSYNGLWNPSNIVNINDKHKASQFIEAFNHLRMPHEI
jgi:hypothetical protein